MLDNYVSKEQFMDYSLDIAVELETLLKKYPVDIVVLNRVCLYITVFYFCHAQSP